MNIVIFMTLLDLLVSQLWIKIIFLLVSQFSFWHMYDSDTNNTTSIKHVSHDLGLFIYSWRCDATMTCGMDHNSLINQQLSRLIKTIYLVSYVQYVTTQNIWVCVVNSVRFVVLRGFFFTFSNFHQLDLHNKLALQSTNLQRNISKNWTSLDLVMFIRNACLLISQLDTPSPPNRVHYWV